MVGLTLSSCPPTIVPHIPGLLNRKHGSAETPVPDVKYPSHILVFFLPSCTSKVQPIDAGIIQAIKALFRKRHMAWILEQLNNTPLGEKPMFSCNIWQAVEWFMASLHEVGPTVMANCWIATKFCHLPRCTCWRLGSVTTIGLQPTRPLGAATLLHLLS